MRQPKDICIYIYPALTEDLTGGNLTEVSNTFWASDYYAESKKIRRNHLPCVSYPFLPLIFTCQIGPGPSQGKPRRTTSKNPAANFPHTSIVSLVLLK